MGRAGGRLWGIIWGWIWVCGCRVGVLRRAGTGGRRLVAGRHSSRVATRPPLVHPCKPRHLQRRGPHHPRVPEQQAACTHTVAHHPPPCRRCWTPGRPGSWPAGQHSKAKHTAAAAIVNILAVAHGTHDSHTLPSFGIWLGRQPARRSARCALWWGGSPSHPTSWGRRRNRNPPTSRRASCRCGA